MNDLTDFETYLGKNYYFILTMAQKEKNDIVNRDDVSLLVNTFYGKIRRHDLLGPIFNSIITGVAASVRTLKKGVACLRKSNNSCGRRRTFVRTDEHRDSSFYI